MSRLAGGKFAISGNLDRHNNWRGSLTVKHSAVNRQSVGSTPTPFANTERCQSGLSYWS